MGWVSLSAADPRVDFSRQILPILSDNCFACHGPDEQQRKAKLRLDVDEDARKPGKSGRAAIVPGHPDQSGLVERIVTRDPDDLMPPPKTGKHLKPEQIDLLKRWIAEGARYEKHWAFVAPQRPELPEVKAPQWPRNELDRFVLARLDQENLSPSAEADRTTLARRASLDLTGLPPTPAEVDAFLTDRSPEAYAKLVDRLLASPRYGEQMARYWMDAARYADSHGYHIDSERHLWKWRDWVIDAFNRNLPFDEFTREQLAGDLLPNATAEQKVASGFVRNNMSTGEGGVIEDEYQAKYTFDRTETTGTIWLGLTLTCARCHNHKYDPVAQKEYYGLYAFFNNLDEPVMDGNRPNPDPFLKLPTPAQSERQAWLKEHLEATRAKREAPDAALDAAEATWSQSWKERLGAGLAAVKPTEVAATNGTVLVIEADGAVLASGPNPSTERFEWTAPLAEGRLGGLRLDVLPHASLPQGASGRAEDGAFQLSELEAELLPPAKEGEETKPQKLRFNLALADASAEGHEAGKAIDENGDSTWMLTAGSGQHAHSLLLLTADPVKVAAGTKLRVRLRYEDPKVPRAIGRFRLLAVCGDDAIQAMNAPKVPAWQVIGPFKSDGLKAGLAKAYPPESEIDLTKAYPGVREEIKWQARSEFEDGSSHLLVNELHGVHGVYYFHRAWEVPEARRVDLRVRADDLFQVWVNGAVVARREEPEKPGEGPLLVPVDLKAGKNEVLIKVVNLQGACFFSYYADLDRADLPAREIAALLGGLPQVSPDQAKQVRQYFRRVTSAEHRQLANQVALWSDEAERLERAIVTTMVAKERTQVRETRMLMRGEYDKPGEVVRAAVPVALPPLPDGAPTNRLGLAQWLVDPRHPLTARVTVNRIWQQFFGVGLVKTAEDFGVQGERPSHPELLDWLATEFVRSGWDVKHLCRLLVTSATYRQVSAVRPDLLARDPENRLLARGPRFRVDGEVVRDTALAASGLLVEKVGGKSARPYEPPGLWEAVSFNNSQKYVQDQGEGNYRRSLYTHWKRQSPPPNMLIFDAPTREYCVARRPRTNTPLQALALLNDPQFVEASRALAWRMMNEGGSRASRRAAYGFRLATGRKPNSTEVKVLTRLYEAQLAEYRRNRDAAEKLLTVGAFRPKSAPQPEEWAAWTSVANLLLNLDETITKS